MSEKYCDVLIAGYETIEAAEKDFDALVHLVQSEKIKTTQGVLLVEHSEDDEIHVRDAANHIGRKGLEWGGGAGVVLGLFAPPLLASALVGAAVGAIVGKFAKHHEDHDIARKAAEAVPKGRAGIVTLVGEDDSDEVKGTLGGATKISVVGVDGDGVRELRDAVESAVADAAASGGQSDQ